jgi:hypothetical protein
MKLTSRRHIPEKQREPHILHSGMCSMCWYFKKQQSSGLWRHMLVTEVSEKLSASSQSKSFFWLKHLWCDARKKHSVGWEWRSSGIHAPLIHVQPTRVFKFLNGTLRCSACNLRCTPFSYNLLARPTNITPYVFPAR